MKFTIRKSDITDILSKVQGITGRKSNLAITANILVKTNETGISFIATDLETGFEGNYPANVESTGVITINARKFFEIVQNFPSDDILIEEVERQWIRISSDKVEYHIVGMSPDDFPDIPVLEDVQYMEIDAIKLRKMIEKTIMISPSSDEKRAHITGVFFESVKEDHGKIIRMVSTDGRRLSKAEFVSGGDLDFYDSPGVIIPKKGLSEVSKLLDSDGIIAIGVKDNYFIVKKDHETIIIGLLEGDFPAYSEIVVKDDHNSIKIEKRNFNMMLKRMSILSTESYNGVIFNFEKNRLMVTATNPDLGESKENFSITFDREPIEVAFNPKYFMETISVIEEDSIMINIRDSKSPCIIEGTEDKHFLSVIMPMKI
ncbi:MAG: DNA polymerase III subunit beta [Proteobacteria bacterium]|nr:DNA polymerase III subunit beta [Pseudomonadota bacterium]